MCLTVLIHTPQLPSREATPCPPSLCPSVSGPCAHRVFVGLTHGAEEVIPADRQAMVCHPGPGPAWTLKVKSG